MKFSTRAERIEPFYVMEVAKAAQALAREVAGTREPMIFLNIGEPDFTAPPLVQEAALRAVHSGATQYTNALGLDALRERISGWYQSRFGVNVPARRIVVTAGASAALQLACLGVPGLRELLELSALGAEHLGAVAAALVATLIASELIVRALRWRDARSRKDPAFAVSSHA